MPRSLPCFLGLLATSLWTSASAQTPGSLDLSFNPNDVGYGHYDGVGESVGSSSLVRQVARMPDGRLVMVGSFTWHDTKLRNVITRSLPNGELDESFEPAIFGGGSVWSVAVQDDGKILVGGSFEEVDDQPYVGLVRLNEDGSLDPSFEIGAGFAYLSSFPATVEHIAIKADGKIICAGRWDTVDGISSPRIVQLGTNGAVDASFAVGAGFNHVLTGLAVQPDGMVLVSGWFDEYNGQERDRIARLTSTGQLDATFAPTFEGGSGGTAVLDLRPDGKIWFGGNWTSVNGVPRDKFVLLTATGATDPSFVPPPSEPSTFVNAVAGQADGSLVVGWHINEPWQTDQQFLTRYFADGSEDPLFAGPDFNGSVEHLLVDDEDHIIVAGWFSRYGRKGECSTTRLLSNGAVDPEWSQASAFDAAVVSVQRLWDGKLLCGGVFVAYDHRSANRIARLGPNGEHDTTFYAWGGLTNRLSAIAVQPDGKALVGGRWYPGRMARLHIDGSLDESFTYGGPDIAVWRIALQSDGRILVLVGNYVVRLLQDGSVDPTFDTGSGFNGQPQDMVLLNNGQVIIVGWFSTYNGETVPQIVRLLNNGTRDTNFDPGTGFGGYGPVDMERQPDGKLLVTGHFTQYNGQPAPGIVRIGSNGAHDATFNVGTGPDDDILVIRYGPDGMIYLGGNFSTVDGQSSPGLARLTTTGALDTGFDVGSGTSVVLDMLFEPDHDLIIAGGFTSYNGVGRNRIARIFGGLTTSIPSRSAEAAFTVAPNPSRGTIAIEVGNELLARGSHWLRVVDTQGRMVYEDRLGLSRTTLHLDLASGTYALVLRDDERDLASRPLVIE